MKDLLVITADADMQAVMNAVLSRPQSLGIRVVAFDVRRHDGRDSGLFRDGPESTRSLKGQYARLLLMWDFHGSGQEARATPDSSADDVQRRLDSVTWREISSSVALAPELEEWLWHCPAALARWLECPNDAAFRIWLEEYGARERLSVEEAKQRRPKELLEFVCRKARHRLPRPQDFDRVASDASLADWRNSRSFRRVVDQLRQWFPKPPAA